MKFMVKVNKEESTALQYTAFANGYSWCSGTKIEEFANNNYIIFSPNSHQINWNPTIIPDYRQVSFDEAVKLLTGKSDKEVFTFTDNEYGTSYEPLGTVYEVEIDYEKKDVKFDDNTIHYFSFGFIEALYNKFKERSKQ